jgi:hypothetical protein
VCISQEYIPPKYINSLRLSCCVLFLSHEYSHKNVIRVSSATTISVYKLSCNLLGYVFRLTIKELPLGGRIQRENCTYVAPYLILVLIALKPQLVHNKIYMYKGKIHPRTDHEGREGEQMYSSTLPSTSALNVSGWSTPRPGHFTPGKDPVLIVQEAGLAPEKVWTGVENLAVTEIRSPDRPARSESLYRLSNPCPICMYMCMYIYIYIFKYMRCRILLIVRCI